MKIHRDNVYRTYYVHDDEQSYNINTRLPLLDTVMLIK